MTAPAKRFGRIGRAVGRRRRVRTPDPLAQGRVAVRASGVSVDLGSERILTDVHVEALNGELLALVGPNGAGKSTLLSVLAGDLRPSEGDVVLDGLPTEDWSTLELAMRRAVLLQQSSISFPFTVRQIVAMGRTPWAGQEPEERDQELVAAALAATDVAHLAERVFTSLSGGERARASVARVIAQDADLLLLDEPTAALDIRHQEDVLRLARRETERARAVVVVMHDLGLAAAHADRVVVLCGGRVVAHGAPADTLTEELLSEVYEHDVEVLRHPRTGAVLVLPRRPAGCRIVNAYNRYT